MRIEIDTNGYADETKILINGKTPPELTEFNLTIRAGRKVKLQMTRDDKKGQPEFISYFGDDFKKMDEVQPIKK